MSTLSGATANKLMTNTWLDDKISPKYTTFPFLTFSITWKLTSGNYTTTKTCKYNALNISGVDRIIYGITDWTHNAGITDSAFTTGSLEHSRMAMWGRVLSMCYLPVINNQTSISYLLELAEFPITKVQEHLGNLPIGTYTLSQIQSAISSMGTITVLNSREMSSIEKYFYRVSNGGVEYGGNKINYDGTPPSAITSYISGEPNTSKRVITYKDYNNIFTGTSGNSLKCVREDVNDFNEVIYYAVPGTVYTTYYGPGHASNVCPLHGVDLNQTTRVTIIPPTMTGLQKWNKENAGFNAAHIIPVLNLNKGGLDKQMFIGNGESDTKLNALNIFWNLENKPAYGFATTAFFGKCTRLDNDGSGSLLGASGANLLADKDMKIYPGDIFGRQPYMTPSILQDSPYDIYKVSYLPFSTAVQYYKHPTMNRYLTSSDGLDSKTIDGTSYAVVPVIYIPSTIRMYSSMGSCVVTLTPTQNSFPLADISFTSNMKFYIYKYAYGNLSSVSNNNNTQRVYYDDIRDMSAFLNQLNSKSNFTGTMDYTQRDSVGDTRSYTAKFTPKVTFTASSDSSGYLILTANAQNYSNLALYNGYDPILTTIGTTRVVFNSVDIEGFLIGGVSSTERTTHTSFTVWTHSGGGTSSASLTNVIGDFDNE